MPYDHAKLVADTVEAELRGIPSHGVVRIKDYLGLWSQNRLNINAKPKIEYETLSTALVDGDNGLGMISGNFAMQSAISKANDAGRMGSCKQFKSFWYCRLLCTNGNRS